MCTESQLLSRENYLPKSNGEKLAVWIKEKFEENRDALGYPSYSNTRPSFLVTNDLINKFFSFFILTNEKDVVVNDFPEAIAYLFRAYHEPRTRCCSFWFSLPLLRWKEFFNLKDMIELQKEIGNDDVVEIMTKIMN